MSSVETPAALSALQRRFLWVVRGLAAIPVLACLVWVGSEYAANRDLLGMVRIVLILPYVAILILLRERTCRRGLKLAEGWGAVLFIILGLLLLNAVGEGSTHNVAFLGIPIILHAAMFLVARLLFGSLPKEAQDSSAARAPHGGGTATADPKLFRGLKLLAGLPTLTLLGGLFLSLGEDGPVSLVVFLLLIPYGAIMVFLLAGKYRKAAVLTRNWGAIAFLLTGSGLVYALATEPVFALLVVPLLLWHAGMLFEGRRILRNLPAQV